MTDRRLGPVRVKRTRAASTGVDTAALKAVAAAMAWRPGTAAVLATAGREATAALWRPAAGTALAWLDPQRLLVATELGTLRAIDANQLAAAR